MHGEETWKHVHSISHWSVQPNLRYDSHGQRWISSQNTRYLGSLRWSRSPFDRSLKAWCPYWMFWFEWRLEFFTQHTPQSISPQDRHRWAWWNFHVPKMHVVVTNAKHQYQMCCWCRWLGRMMWDWPWNPLVHVSQGLLETGTSRSTRSHWASWKKPCLEDQSLLHSSWLCCLVWSVWIWCHNNQ